MMGNSTVLFESLFNRDISAIDNEAFLSGLAKEYPYFTAAHFYLLKRTALPGGEEYLQQPAQASILFNNPWWLNFQLLEADIVNNATATITAPVIEELPSTEEKTAQVISHEDPAEIKDPFIDHTPAPSWSNDDTSVISNQPEETINDNNETVSSTIVDATGYSNAITTSETTLPTVIEIENIADTSTQPPVWNPEIAGVAPNDYSESKENGQVEEDAITTADTFASADQPVNISEPVILEEDPNTANISEPATPSPVAEYPAAEDIAVAESEQAKPVTDNNPLAGTAPGGNNGESLLFEPLYTTDYFASQGIKLSEEVQPGDKLGRQLKSFTEWLKTMKKVHSNKLPEGNESTDKAIQTLAERSNADDEVVTEAMAEVLLQQHKQDKAIEVYQKLSLLNPSKIAYFAAKIEKLKEQ